jgi:hypothetical protein
MATFFESKEKEIESWVDEACIALSSLFKTREDFVDYLNSFENPKDAELLLRVCQFYFVSKKHQPQSYVKLIMIISAIEKLANKEKEFQEFCDWIQGRKKEIEALLPKSEIVDVTRFMGIINTLEETYFQEFGSRRNVYDFLNDHLTSGDKVRLIRSIKSRRIEVIPRHRYVRMMGLDKFRSIDEAKVKLPIKVEKHFVSHCYDFRKCSYAFTDCEPDLDCLLEEDPVFRDKTLKKVVDDIYRIRSDFVHDAIITPLNEKSSMFLLGTIGKKAAFIELTAEDLENMFENALKHYFDQLPHV